MLKNILTFLVLVALCAPIAASENLVEDFQTIFSTENRDAKKDILVALEASDLKDDVVLPLLVQAVGDRQVKDIAVQQLRHRTGLSPSHKRGVGGYPAYPVDDSFEQWTAWLKTRELLNK
jgi:hypothetical protein